MFNDSLNCSLAKGTGAEAQGCSTGWRNHSDSCYVFVHEMYSWFDAKAACDVVGGGLVEIQSPEENTFLAQLISSSRATQTWIGLEDIQEEGKFVWVSSGQEPDISHWADHEPDDRHGGEDCAAMRSSGNWFDDACEDTHRHFICEMPTTRNIPVMHTMAKNVFCIAFLGALVAGVQGVGCPDGWHSHSGSCYIYMRVYNWFDARAACDLLGGRMVEVERDEENQYLAGLIRSYGGGTQIAWIGLEDILEEGQFGWVSTRAKAAYTNWGHHEPDDRHGAEDCAAILSNGQWIDIPCEASHYHSLCELP
ncbi:hypothetical protein ACOMHN_043802 [Nucella lapillus]